MPPIHDPSTYERMSRPFPTQADAEEALNAFFHGVRELRIELGIRDVHIAVLDSIEGDAEVPREIFVDMHIGSSAFAMPMAAAALGAQKGRHEQRLADYEAMGRDYGKRTERAEAVVHEPPPAGNEPGAPPAPATP